MLNISADTLSLTKEFDILGSAGKFRLSPIGVEGAVDLVKLDLSQSELVRVEAPPSRFWKTETYTNAPCEGTIEKLNLCRTNQSLSFVCRELVTTEFAYPDFEPVKKSFPILFLLLRRVFKCHTKSITRCEQFVAFIIQHDISPSVREVSQLQF